MGVSNLVLLNNSNPGTARDFGLRATARSETSKNPHSPDSPIWMPPGHVLHDPAIATDAKAISDCAKRVNENPLPNSAACKITDYTSPPQQPARPPQGQSQSISAALTYQLWPGGFAGSAAIADYLTGSN
jgi:hypothetical protein